MSFTDETFSVISRHLKNIEKLPKRTSPMETFGLGMFLDYSFSKDVQSKNG